MQVYVCMYTDYVRRRDMVYGYFYPTLLSMTVVAYGAYLISASINNSEYYQSTGVVTISLVTPIIAHAWRTRFAFYNSIILDCIVQ